MLLRAIVALAVLAVASPARAGDPDRVWRTVETDHFVVHYYEPHDDLAHRVGVVAERAHTTLAPALGRVPDEKTVVILLDDTDGANGFANVLPRNRITLYATAPGGDSGLNDHDDWLYGLVAHEYTHILHLDSIGGLAKLVNRVLGKTWAPNQVQPRWLIEGLATYEETKRSSSGRGRSAVFDMYLRVPVLADEDLDLDAVTNGPYEFPRGNAAYLYGSKFLQYVFDRFGDDVPREMSWVYGQTTIPYAINRQIHEVVGKPFTELWGDWKGYLRDDYTVQLEAMERREPREGRRLTFDAEGDSSPQYTADGKELIYVHNDGHAQQRLRAIPIGGNVGDARDVLDLDRTGAYTLMKSGSVVFEQGWTFRNEYSYQDLVVWDRISGQQTRLTRGKRARDPAVSPDDAQVAFSMNGGSRSRLAVMPLQPDAEPRVLWKGDRYDQAFQPAWSPDGTKIAFSAWRTGGYRDVLIVDVATAEVTALTHDRAIDGDPVWSPDGAHLFFASDRTGIYDIYAHELATGELWQVTDVLGGAFEPTISPDGTRLAYHGFDTGGFDIYELAIDRATWTPALPYVDDRPASTVVPDDEAEVSASRPYRALESLAPDAWMAELALDSAIGSAITVSAGGSDVAGLHSWQLGTTLSLDDASLNVGLTWGYDGLRIPVRATLGRSLADRTGYRIDGVSQGYREESVSTTVSFSVPTRRGPYSSLSLSGDLDFDRFRLVDVPADPLDPSEITPRVPTSNYFQDGVALRASWSTVDSFVHVQGPSEGVELNGSIRLDHPALGATYRNLSLNWSARAYAKMPFSPDATLSLRYAGGARVGDIDRGDAFGLGAIPDQDIASAFISTARMSSTGFLRGYESRVVTGDTYELVNVEYRQRIVQIERGLLTLPIYVRRLHAAALFDAGAAYDGELARDDIKVSAGGALRLDVTLGYFAPGSFEVGYARGLSSEGIHETWLRLTTTL